MKKMVVENKKEWFGFDLSGYYLNPLLHRDQVSALVIMLMLDGTPLT